MVNIIFPPGGDSSKIVFIDENQTKLVDGLGLTSAL